jgi:hypothetical protein
VQSLHSRTTAAGIQQGAKEVENDPGRMNSLPYSSAQENPHVKIDRERSPVLHPSREPGINGPHWASWKSILLVQGMPINRLI